MASPSPKKCALGVLVSGSGSNLQAIIDASEAPEYPARIAVVISNKKEAFALERAKKAKIPTIVLEHQNYASREDYDRELVRHLQEHGIDLVVLAGFMRILSPTFIQAFPDKIMNIHPALLPAFPGTHAIQQAFDYGVTVTGVTVHFVDQGMDTGPIILQKEVLVSSQETLETLMEKIHLAEHTIYPQAIQLFAENRLALSGRKVSIKGSHS